MVALCAGPVVAIRGRPITVKPNVIGVTETPFSLVKGKDTVDEPPPDTAASELFPANKVTTAISSVKHVTVPTKAVGCDSCGQNARLGDTSKTPVSPFSDTVSGPVSDVAKATEPAVMTAPPADSVIGRVDDDADVVRDNDSELDDD